VLEQQAAMALAQLVVLAALEQPYLLL